MCIVTWVGIPNPTNVDTALFQLTFWCQIFIQIILSYFRITFNIYVHQISLILVMFKLKIRRGV